jgi:hypothetical protein
VEPSRRAESFDRLMHPASYPDAPPVEAEPPLVPGLPPPGPPTPPPRPKRSLTPWLVAALTVTLLALVASLVAYRDQRQEADRLAAELEAANARIEDLERQLGEIDATGEGVPSLEDLLAQLLEELFGPGPGNTGNDGDPFGDLQMLQCLAPGGFTGVVDEVDGEAAAQVDEIGDLVAADRELAYAEGEPEAEFLSDHAATDRLIELHETDYPPGEAALDARLLQLLGVIPQATNLRDLSLDLLTEGVAGFYVPATGELVVRSDDPTAELGPMEQVTLAHELEHALADQNHELLDSDIESRGGDGALAALSVIEGDANLTGQRFALAHLTLQDQLDLAASPEVTESQARLDAAPHYITRQLLFPYQEGMSFVCSRFLDGGWDAVDQMYAAPPASTAEILAPDRYGQQPVDARDPGVLGEPWAEARRDTFGAADLLFLFEAPADDETRALDDPLGAATAWAGGEYVLYIDGAESAVGISLAAVAGQEDVLCRAVEDFIVRADMTHAAVRCDGANIRAGIAGDDATAQALIA